MAGGWRRNAEISCQLAAVPDLAVQMRQHGPEAAQLLGGQTHAELGNIPLEEGANVSLAPARAGQIAGGQIAAGIAATQPEALLVFRRGADFVEAEGREFVVFDASGQRLGTLASQVGRC